MSILINYGFNSHFQQLYIPHQKNGLLVGRVSSIQGYKYLLITDLGNIEGEISGTLLNSKENWELPKVGDWVVYTEIERYCYIIEVLTRQNELARKHPGKSSEKQVLVTNIDFALIVQAVDQDFNLMRLQRYLHQVYESGIKPIVILNKSDLVTDPFAFINEVNNLGFPVTVITASTLTIDGLNILKSSLVAGKTYVLLGSSGVGKSSLLNNLLNDNIQITNEISQANNKGKHTTTFRYLTKLSNGSVFIDTPGMREFGLTSDVSSDAKFIHPQIEELSKKCKFDDCQHVNEPKCAVVAAVKGGELPEIVYRSYAKLMKEQKRFSTTVQEKRKNERQFGKISRDAQDHKRKWKS